MFLNALISLRKAGIVALIDFKKYDYYHIRLKYSGEEIIDADTIPIDFTLLGLSSEDMFEKFKNYNMPKIVLTK